MGKKIIVTGSNGLIGKVIAAHLASENDVLPLSRSLGHDLTDENFVRDLFRENRGDVLINLFAVNDHIDLDEKKNSSLFDVSLQSFRDYMEVNVTSLFSVCREFARHNRPGNIINFSSIYGVVSPIPTLYDGIEKHIGYSTSKAAVIQMTRHLAVHLAPYVRVNCIVPGGVQDNQGQAFIDGYSQNAPLGRMMEAEELVGIVDYLVSDKSSYATGGVFVVDGGWTAI